MCNEREERAERAQLEEREEREQRAQQEDRGGHAQCAFRSGQYGHQRAHYHYERTDLSLYRRSTGQHREIGPGHDRKTP